MKALYRTAAAVLTLLSAGATAILISVVVDGDRDVHVLGFALLAVGAALALAAAIALWARTLER